MHLMTIAVIVLSSLNAYQFVTVFCALPSLCFNVDNWLLKMVGAVSRTWGILFVLLSCLYFCLVLADKFSVKRFGKRLFTPNLSMELLMLIPLSITFIFSLL